MYKNLNTDPTTDNPKSCRMRKGQPPASPIGLAQVALLILCSLSTARSQSSDPWTQVGQSILGDQPGNYGWLLRANLDGSIIAIGSYPHTGIGYVDVYQKDASEQWVQMGQRILGKAGDYTGRSSLDISADGKRFIIGAYLSNIGATSGGLARVYTYDEVGGTWTQTGQDIFSTVTYDEIGYSASISDAGDIIAVGSRNYNSVRGKVDTYKLVGGSWTAHGSIVGEATNLRSGAVVELSGSGEFIAVGAPSYNPTSGPASSGRVRVYQYIGGYWTQQGNDILGEMEMDQSPSSLSLSYDGSVLAIGASSNDPNGLTSAGHVRVFELVAGTWTQRGADIDGDNAADGAGWSTSLSSSGTVLSTGLYGNDIAGVNAGVVRIYQYDGGEWQLWDSIFGEASELFGRSVSLSGTGNMLAAQSYTFKNDAGSNIGRVRVFSAPSTASLPASSGPGQSFP